MGFVNCALEETLIKNRGTSCVGVRKTGTTLIRVSTVMGTL